MIKTNTAYVAMSADLIHTGYINLINNASKYGDVVVGLLSDEAIISYKQTPIVTWKDRYTVIRALKEVKLVVPQLTHDYTPNLRCLRPACVVHGSDWKTGVQSEVRQKVLSVLEEWGGELIEPEYTKGISTTDILEKCKNDDTAQN